MACSKNNIPHGYGRLISTDNGSFIDGQFKDGKPHGYVRWIHYHGDYWHYEYSNGKFVRRWHWMNMWCCCIYDNMAFELFKYCV